MRKSLFRLFSLFAVGLIGTTALVITLQNKSIKSLPGSATPDGGYNIVLDDTNAPFFEETYDRELGPEQVFEKGDYALNMKYRLAKAEEGYHVTLAPHGYMYNEVDDSTNKNKVTGLSSIKVTYSSSSSISVRTSLRDDGKEFTAPQALTSGVALELDNNPYYFIFEAGDAEAKIESVVLNYTCEAHTGVILNTLTGTYTGKGSDNFTYKLTLDGSNVSLESLDKETNVSDSGTAALLGGNTINCTFDGGGYYMFTISEDHMIFTFSSKGGAANSKFPEMSLYKVYKVEDFESESVIGSGYGGSGQSKDQTKLFAMTGLKAHWHSDFYNNGDTYGPSYINDIKGDGYGWRLMGSTDYLQFTSSKGYNSSKAGVFKGNGNALRNIQMKSVLGIPNIIGKGAYLSFWAKAYSDAALNTIASGVTDIKALCFYTGQVTKTTQADATEKAFTIPGSSDWARYVVELDTTKDYYSFGFNTKQAGGGTRYVIVDNVEIYSADPYAEYVAPTPVTGVSVSPTALALNVGQHSTLTATVAPDDATNKNVSWSTSNSNVATVSNGTVTAVAAGNATITVTTDDGGLTATCDVTVSVPSSIPYPEGTFMAVVGSYKFVIAIGNETNGLVAVRVSTADAVATGIAFDDDDGEFAITTTGNVGGYTVGKITGVYDYANDQLVHVGCDGQIGAAVSDVTLTRPANLLDCDGNTATLQAAFNRRYRTKGSSKWDIDTGNGDRILSETTNILSGAGSMSLRPCGSTYDAYGFVLKNDMTPQTLGSIHFWVYNPCDYDITFRGYYYTSASFGSNGAIGFAAVDKAKAHSWTYVSRGFTSSTVYNFTISVWTADQTEAATSMAARLVFDDILVY